MSDVNLLAALLDSKVRFGSTMVLRCPFCSEGSELMVDPEMERWAVTDWHRAVVTVQRWMAQHAERHAKCAEKRTTRESAEMGWP